MSVDPTNSSNGMIRSTAQAQVFLRTAGQMDSCGPGGLSFGQMDSSGSFREFWRPPDFAKSSNTLYFLVRSNVNNPQTSFQKETATTYAPIFRSAQFTYPDLIMAYSMSQATRVEVSLERKLTRKTDHMEPPPAQLPGDCHRTGQRC